MDIYKTRTIIFAISAMFAAIAGVLIAYDVGMDPYVGMPMLLNAFTRQDLTIATT
jgi:branched-subunit amino acid ABC-type transport system permease component